MPRVKKPKNATNVYRAPVSICGILLLFGLWHLICGNGLFMALVAFVSLAFLVF